LHSKKLKKVKIVKKNLFLCRVVGSPWLRQIAK